MLGPLDSPDISYQNISNMCLHMKLCVEPDFSGFADYHGQQGQSPQGAIVALLSLMCQPIRADSKNIETD